MELLDTLKYFAMEENTGHGVVSVVVAASTAIYLLEVYTFQSRRQKK